MTRFPRLCLLLASSVLFATSLAVPTASSAPIPKFKYEDNLRACVKRWWPDYPSYEAGRAQVWQESRDNTRAVSPVGAAGLAQFMPGTWREVTAGSTVSVFDPEANIERFCYYQGKMRRAWKAANRTAIDRNELGQASYNAGMGNILKAQARCGDALLIDEVLPCLPQVTGEKNAHETSTYVYNIRRWIRQIRLGG